MSARTHLPSGLVTFLFTDIEGSTRLARMLGAGYLPVLSEHRRLLRRTLATSDGAELFTEGDSFFVAFADAGAAMAACASAQRALTEHEWPTPDSTPRVRMGLHTGHAEPVGGEYASPEVHRAARIAAAAHGGQVLCSAATARHAAPLPADASLLDLGLHRLRGFDDRERLFQLVAPGLERQFPRPRTVDAATHNLPNQATAFVGREAERAELDALVRGHRLVTVVGAGGAGKTRLAVELAARTVGVYPDGVWFVDIATVTDPGLVAFAIAAVLGLRPEPGRPIVDTLVEHATSRRMLLLLDTCDAHLPAVADVTARLLTGGSGVHVLATSREPFGLPGEVVWRIPPLSVEPPPGGGPSDAVALLLERTSAARGGRFPSPAESVDLQRVVARLDGLPLAIELAAARLRVLSAGQLAERLDDVLGTLDAGRSEDAGRTEDAGRSEDAGRGDDAARGDDAGRPGPARDDRARVRPPGWVSAARGGDGRTAMRETSADARRRALAAGVLVPQQRTPRSVTQRHITMQATVSWSYRTLGPRAARLLRWLSVFSGPVDLPTVEWLLEEDALDPLAVLVDKSMIQAEPHASGSTYRMLDPIRGYAARRLVEAGEERAARDRHVAWALHALRQAHLGRDGQPVTLSLYALDPLADEVRAGLRWSATGGSARRGLQLSSGLDQWWRERGIGREGRLWLFRLYGRIAETGEPIPEAELAAAYHMHSLHAGADGEFAEELRFSQRAEAAARQAGDAALLARVLGGRGATLIDMGQLVEAERVCREVIDGANADGVAGDGLFAVYSLAELLWRRGALDEAAELLGAARPVEATRPVERGRRTVDMLLGMVALARRDLVAAHDHLVVALRSRMTYGFHRRACETLNAMAVRCALGGDPVTAARLFGAAQATRTVLRGTPGMFGAYWADEQAAVRSAIGDPAFDAAYAEGAELSLEEAAVVALAVEHPDLTIGSRRFAGGEMGAREATPRHPAGKREASAVRDVAPRRDPSRRDSAATTAPRSARPRP
ncbi:Adenylate and Guanylate cyclase catalytic domain-containing protein [Micromonospora pattaloongensis]|uniref:Adenylate and Guanylate cyclase catalytic domain-containing protein n=1 Tax=Micromonospora pattaloongensis TaxID=405436 RepID=A0A1H3GRM9_9ACTN|nr:adenylate/guanylate cyclase domain-containing protein [Micromonospora pattaloongensis]SDY05931.1 Adenylate and Guanylate cyclase catalytic domain-containing protein [Micromonospora pattaloongensis]